MIAINADYVGGIVGWNTVNGVLSGAGNSNEGRVEGNSYVGGVAGRNDAAITGELNSMIGIKNSGVVIAHKGGAGGIFGENKGDITYVEMINNGIVTGTDGEGTGLNGTGGIFGVNSGTVTYSSLKNQVDGQVIGTQNVGGLIGVNTGTITGGRDEKDGYYKYQIYNNGTIQVGTWTDSDRDGIIDTNEFTAAAGENIGGLFGTNNENVTAAYNTGAIIAGSSTNVGGIAGTNTGKLDQVFNTVITGVNADGSTQYGSITGKTNVGGIVGFNEAGGTVSNAYNTSTVSGSIAGAIVGTNNGTISNVYTTVSGNLVHDNDDTGVAHGYNTTKPGNWTSGTSYVGFDFDSTSKDGTESIWKIYEGSTNPLLKVFLTKLMVNEEAMIDGDKVSLKDYLNLVYNGGEQDINIQDLINKGFITGPEGMKDTEGNSFAFDAYDHTKEDGDGLGNSTLLYNTKGQIDAGEYSGWIASAQIDAGGGFVNNLGYDIDFGTREIDKAQISVTLNDVNRTYGDKKFTNGTYYGYTYEITNGTLTDEMEGELNDGITFGQKTDGAVDNPTGTVTNNANKDNENYTWTADFGLQENVNKNYTFVTGQDQTGSTVTVSGKSHVDRAELTITADSETIYVGGIPHYTGTVDHFVNGDSFKVDFGVEDSSIERWSVPIRMKLDSGEREILSDRWMGKSLWREL